MTREENAGIEFALNNFKAPRVLPVQRKRMADGSYKVRVSDIWGNRCTMYFTKEFINRCSLAVSNGCTRWSLEQRVDKNATPDI